MGFLSCGPMVCILFLCDADAAGEPPDLVFYLADTDRPVAAMGRIVVASASEPADGAAAVWNCCCGGVVGGNVFRIERLLVRLTGVTELGLHGVNDWV